MRRKTGINRASIKECTTKRSTEETVASNRTASGLVRRCRMSRFSIPSHPCWKITGQKFGEGGKSERSRKKKLCMINKKKLIQFFLAHSLLAKDRQMKLK